MRYPDGGGLDAAERARYSALSLLTCGLLTPVIAGIGVTITLFGRRMRRE